MDGKGNYIFYESYFIYFTHHMQQIQIQSIEITGKIAVQDDQKCNNQRQQKQVIGEKSEGKSEKCKRKKWKSNRNNTSNKLDSMDHANSAEGRAVGCK